MVFSGWEDLILQRVIFLVINKKKKEGEKEIRESGREGGKKTGTEIK